MGIMKVLSIKDTKVQNIIELINQRKIETLYSIILLLGMFLGAVFSGKQSSDILDLKVFFDNFLLSRRSSSFVDIFTGAFISNFTYLLLLFLGGMFALGSISDGVVLLFKGTSLGVLMGYSYLIYGLKGAAFAIIIILPGAFITALAFVYSSKESCLFSLYFFRLFTNNPPLTSIKQDFKKYCVKFIVVILLITFSALADGLLTRVFWKVFNL